MWVMKLFLWVFLIELFRSVSSMDICAWMYEILGISGCLHRFPRGYLLEGRRQSRQLLRPRRVVLLWTQGGSRMLFLRLTVYTGTWDGV